MHPLRGALFRCYMEKLESFISVRLFLTHTLRDAAAAKTALSRLRHATHTDNVHQTQ